MWFWCFRTCVNEVQFQQQAALFFMGLPQLPWRKTEAVLGPSVG